MNKKILSKIKELDVMIIRSFTKKEKNCHIPTPTQMRIIKYITESKNKVYQRDLEKVLNLRRATVSGVLSTMEKNNLIKRVIDSDDTRVKQIILNDDVEKIFKENKKRFSILEDIVIRNITEEEINVFSKVLDKMIYNIKSYQEGKDNND